MTTPASPTPPPTNPVANELFLRGVERISRFNRLDTRSAIDILEEATRLDPAFVEAWARLAEAYRQMGIVFAPGENWIRKAEFAIRKAMALDSRNADVQCIRGRVLWTAAKGFQNRAALKALHDAQKVNPGCYQALVEGGCLLFHVGLYEQADELLRKTLAVSPDDVSALSYLAMTAVYKGDYEEAERHRERGARINPTNVWNSLLERQYRFTGRNWMKPRERSKPPSSSCRRSRWWSVWNHCYGPSGERTARLSRR